MTQLQQQIVERLNRGERNRDIAKALGCTPTAISYVKHGRRGVYLTMAKKDRIEELWFAGELGAVEISELVHLALSKTIAYIQKLEREEAAKCRA